MQSFLVEGIHIALVDACPFNGSLVESLVREEYNRHE